jgi:hypothetical protein
MKISKETAIKDIKRAKAVDATRVTSDDLNASNSIKDITRGLETRLRAKKDVTVIVIE